MPIVMRNFLEHWISFARVHFLAQLTIIYTVSQKNSHPCD